MNNFKKFLLALLLFTSVQALAQNELTEAMQYSRETQLQHKSSDRQSRDVLEAMKRNPRMEKWNRLIKIAQMEELFRRPDVVAFYVDIADFENLPDNIQKNLFDRKNKELIKRFLLSYTFLNESETVVDLSFQKTLINLNREEMPFHWEMIVKSQSDTTGTMHPRFKPGKQELNGIKLGFVSLYQNGGKSLELHTFLPGTLDAFKN